MKKRTLAIFLTLCMLQFLFPAAALAAGGADITVTTEAQLMDALNQTTPVDSIRITSGFTITNECTIRYDGGRLINYSGVEVIIENGVTLTIGNGGNFENAWYSFGGVWGEGLQPNGHIENRGTVIVENGGFYGGGINNGTITVKSGGICMGNLLNNGTVTTEAGGLLASTQGGDIDNFGTISISQGANLVTWMGGGFNNKNGGTLNLAGDFLAGGMIHNGNENFWYSNAGSINTVSTGKVFTTYAASESVRSGLMTDFNVSEVLAGVPIRTESQLKAAVAGGKDFGPVAEELYGRLAGARNSSASNIILLNNITAHENVRAGYIRVVIPSGVTLTLDETVAFYAEMEIQNGGTVLVNKDAMLSTTMGGGIDNYGTVTTLAGGTFIALMGATITNFSTGLIDVGGTFSISDPEVWNQLGKFRDAGGSITGNGYINIANCTVDVHTDAHTFDAFTGTIKYYAASVNNQTELTEALTTTDVNKPNDFIFLVNYTGAAEEIFTISEPTVIKDKMFIIYYINEEGEHYRNVDFTGDGSLTLENTGFARWMKCLGTTVELYPNGGTLEDWQPYDDLDTVGNTPDIILPTPVRAGYAFAGWQLELFGQDPVLVPAGPYDIPDQTESYTFTARWNPLLVDSQVQLNAAGEGSCVTVSSVDDSIAVLIGVYENDQMVALKLAGSAQDYSRSAVFENLNAGMTVKVFFVDENGLPVRSALTTAKIE